MLITLILIQVSTTTVRDVIFSSSADTHVRALNASVCESETERGGVCVCVAMKQCVLKGRQLIKASQSRRGEMLLRDKISG